MESGGFETRSKVNKTGYFQTTNSTENVYAGHPAKAPIKLNKRTPKILEQVGTPSAPANWLTEE